MEGSIPLKNLRSGERALVERLVGPPDHVYRLEELGLLDGAPIEVFRGGNPCIIRLAGSKVCLRADDRFNVFVRRAGRDRSGQPERTEP